MAAFYREQGPGLFESTELTRGPWDPGSQHAGPPCALLGRALDAAGGIDGAHLTRATFEILGPVPIATLEAEARVVRPGRRVELVEGTLSHEGRAVLAGRAWRIRTTELELDADPPPEEPMPGPEHASAGAFFPTGSEAGYHTAMEVIFLSGSFVEPGPARAWLRMRCQLVEGEDPAPRDRVLVVTDTGNGVASPLDYRRWLYINTDVSAALRRPAEGEWVGLDAVCFVEPNGVGISDSVVHDVRGPIGRATQSLLIMPREG